MFDYLVCRVQTFSRSFFFGEKETEEGVCVLWEIGPDM
jgi:hypothetical protein